MKFNYEFVITLNGTTLLCQMAVGLIGVSVLVLCLHPTCDSQRAAAIRDDFEEKPRQIPDKFSYICQA